jgi:hypothetical protein
LRQHPQTAQAYADLKQSLARQFETDRNAYAEAKTTFIEQVLAEALFGQPPAAADRPPIVTDEHVE